jgi:putative flippase GtrA
VRDFAWRFLRYGVTGGIAAVVDAGGFVLLVNARLSIAVASCLSFCIAALVNYSLTSRFVFNREPTLRGLAAFAAAALIGLMVNIGVTLLGVFTVGLPPLAAKLMGIGTAFIVNFLINLRVVFHAGRHRTIWRDATSSAPRPLAVPRKGLVATPSRPANLPWTRQGILDIRSRLAALKFFFTRSHP